MRSLLAASLLLGCQACSSAPSGGPGATSRSGAATTTASVAAGPTGAATASATASAAGAAAERAGIVFGARGGAPVPFVLFLHGLGASGARLVEVLGVAGLARQLGFAYAAPDGDADGHGQRFWNAGAACCDFEHRGPDHVARLSRIVAAAASDPGIDPARIFVVGFSNGGFMAHRLACADARVTGIGTLGAAGPRDDEPCPARPPLAVVAVNADADKLVHFEGGSVLDRRDVPPHPSARDTVLAWGKRNGCTGALERSGTLDLDASIPGEESATFGIAGCPAPVALWVVHGGSHFSGTSARGTALVYGALVEATVRR
ncbi:MAG: hypothetical protein IT373_20930 [Polyangiaceae bacterium]|nr:hypothetical protein [Polyangiaceae bacterium]